MGNPAIAGRVLVVEDDDAIRTMLLTVLEVSGYETCGVRNGIDGLRKLREWRPQVIVLDLFTPLMDGYELLARRSELGDLGKVPVIVVTPTTASLPSAERLGVWAVLQRPHDVNHLRALIAEAIVQEAPDARARRQGPAGELLH